MGVCARLNSIWKPLVADHPPLEAFAQRDQRGLVAEDAEEVEGEDAEEVEGEDAGGP